MGPNSANSKNSQYPKTLARTLASTRYEKVKISPTKFLISVRKFWANVYLDEPNQEESKLLDEESVDDDQFYDALDDDDQNLYHRIKSTFLSSSLTS